MIRNIEKRAQVPAEAAGRRLDQVLAELFPDYSRSRLAAWVRAGAVRLEGAQVKPRHRLSGGELVELHARVEADTGAAPQPIPLNLVHEDEAILVVNKPAGLVVHPAAGNPDGTLMNALLHHDPALAALPRAGIVHRLDKDTSGLLVVAKTLPAHKRLVEQLQARAVGREYDVLVRGVATSGERIEAPIGRHPARRKRMAVTEGGKPAATQFRVRERYRAHSRLRVKLESGRTHQIRVHMAHIGMPVLGDPTYGGRPVFPKGGSDALRGALESFRRQALHAQRLSLAHPVTGEALNWCASCPEDMRALIALLRLDARDRHEPH